MAILWIPIVSIVGAALHWDWYFIKEMSGDIFGHCASAIQVAN